MATYSDILAWRIPWTEDPGGLQSMRSQRGPGEEYTLSQGRNYRDEMPYELVLSR